VGTCGCHDAISWLDNCPACGEAWELHQLNATTSKGPASWQIPHHWGRGADLSETTRPIGTRHDADALYEALRYIGGAMTDPRDETGLKTTVGANRFEALGRIKSNKHLSVGGTEKGWGPSAQVMVGVLHVGESNDVFATHSGAERDGFREVCDVLGFSYARPLADDERLISRTEKEIPSAYVESPISQRYKCAAPRAIQAALRAREYRYSLTEIWYDPKNVHAKYANAHTIESCDTCRRNVVYMLCPPE